MIKRIKKAGDIIKKPNLFRTFPMLEYPLLPEMTFIIANTFLVLKSLPATPGAICRIPKNQLYTNK
jgi:hypothetical protein